MERFVPVLKYVAIFSHSNTQPPITCFRIVRQINNMQYICHTFLLTWRRLTVVSRLSVKKILPNSLSSWEHASVRRHRNHRCSTTANKCWTFWTVVFIVSSCARWLNKTTPLAGRPFCTYSSRRFVFKSDSYTRLQLCMLWNIRLLVLLLQAVLVSELSSKPVVRVQLCTVWQCLAVRHECCFLHT